MIRYLIAIAFPIAIIGYFIQVWPRLLNKYFGVDVWRNLSIIDYIRQYKQLPDYLPQYMLKGPFDYPPLFLIMLSFLPKPFLERYQGFFAPILDFVHSVFLFVFIDLITQNVFIAATAQIVYILTPIMIMENAQLSSRGFGSLLFTLSFLIIFYFSSSHEMIYLIFALFIVTSLLLSSKMAAQTFFLFSIIFLFIKWDATYLLIFFGGIILAIVMTKGFYLRVLKGHLYVLNYFRKIIDVRYAHQIRGVIAPSQSSDFIGKINAIINKLPIAAFIAGNPFLIFTFVLVVIDMIWSPWNVAVRIDYQSVFEFMKIWLLIVVALGIITAHIKPLLFLGEGMKYLMYSVFPSAFLLATYAIILRGWILWLTILIGLIALAQSLYLQNKVVKGKSHRIIDNTMKEAMNFLQNVSDSPSNIRVATIPFAIADALAYFTDCHVFSSDSGYVLGNSQDYIDYYPFLRKPLKEIVDKYKIDYIFVDTRYAAIEELNLGKYNIVFQSGSFAIVK